MKWQRIEQRKESTIDDNEKKNENMYECERKRCLRKWKKEHGGAMKSMHLGCGRIQNGNGEINSGVYVLNQPLSSSTLFLFFRSQFIFIENYIFRNFH